jgi:uncharacterized metal-binding protein YceD (DUF177 family)
LERLIEYKIPFKGISEGLHEYDFHVQDSFFDAMESELIHKADIQVKLKLDKQSRMIILDFDIQGKVVLTCDRCLGDLDFPISTTHQVIVKYGKGDKEQDNDILYLADEEYQLDVSTLIYENIVLSIPIRNVHPDDENGNSTCDEEQISLLNQYSKRTTNDPRWDALKNLKLED